MFLFQIYKFRVPGHHLVGTISCFEFSHGMQVNCNKLTYNLNLITYGVIGSIFLGIIFEKMKIAEMVNHDENQFGVA